MKGFRLQVVGYSLIFLLLSTVTCNLFTVHAAESSPSADPLRQSDSEASIKSKLEALKKEIASKAAKLKLEVNKRLQNKAYIGMVKQKASTTLTIASKTGPKVINLNQDTIYDIAPKVKGKYSYKNVEEEDYIAALGDIDETDVLTAKKVILLAPMEDNRTILWGQVISISDKLITIKSKDLKNMAVSIGDTSFQKGIEEVDLDVLRTNDFVIIVGLKNKNDIYLARFVYIVPQGGILKPKKVATPSATPKTATTSTKKKS